MGNNKTYEEIGLEIGKLVAEKNKAYGDSFNKCSEVLKQFYPNGVNVWQYKDMLCLVRIIDKMFRIATDKDALGESPYRDIGGYSILGASNVDKKEIS